MSTIDWSKAPADATHWQPETSNLKAAWIRYDGPAIYLSRIVSRPDNSAPSWNGKGLPPVGAVCLVVPHNTVWGFSSTAGHEREILAYHGEFVWLGHEGFALESTRIDKADFLPTRTPEQTAAALRTKACDEMFGVILKLPEERKRNRSDICEALYDAGYRKFEILDGEA